MTTPTLVPQGQHELQRDKSRNEQRRRLAQRVSSRLPWSGSASLINRTKAIRRPNSREPDFEKCKPSDFQAEPRPSRYFSSSLRPPKLRSSKVEKAPGHTQPHCADTSHLTFHV